tara:strand:- start:510 stop:860 length:351 start_codon:yes stop_codon:yes gene_type:complete
MIVALELLTSIPGKPLHVPSDHSVLSPLFSAIKRPLSSEDLSNDASPPSRVSISKKSPGFIPLGQSLLGVMSHELDAELALSDINDIEKIESRIIRGTPGRANLLPIDRFTISASF